MPLRWSLAYLGCMFSINIAPRVGLVKGSLRMLRLFDWTAAGPSDTAGWSLDISRAVGKRNIHEPINDAEILKQFGHTRAPSGAASL